MHFSAHETCNYLFLLCILLKNCQAFKNDGTEIIYPQESSPSHDALGNVSLNRARNGGRGAAGVDTAHERSERGQMGCRELRSTKYISDGQCTSIKPIKELVCAGECLPAPLLPNWIGGSRGKKRFWSRRSSQDWRCVNDKTRTQRIQLQCQDGSARTYKITVVTACKCKRYSRQHNESGNKLEEATAVTVAVAAPAPAPGETQVVHKHKSKSKRKLGKNRFEENWPSPEP